MTTSGIPSSPSPDRGLSPDHSGSTSPLPSTAGSTVGHTNVSSQRVFNALQAPSDGGPLRFMAEKDKHIQNLNDAIVAREAMIDVFQSQIDHLHDEIDQLKGNVTQLETENTGLRTELKTMSERLEAQAAKQKKTVADLLENLTVVQGQGDELKERLEASEELLTKTEARVTKQQEEIVNLTQQLTASKGREESLENRLAETEGRLAETEKTLAETEGRLAETEKTLAETRRLLSEAEAKSAEQRGEIEHLTEQLIEVEKRAGEVCINIPSEYSFILRSRSKGRNS